jgi:hypothetical protein
MISARGLRVAGITSPDWTSRPLVFSSAGVRVSFFWNFEADQNPICLWRQGTVQAGAWPEMTNRSRKSIAYHEAGHVVVYWHLTGHAPIRVTIEPSFGVLGRVDHKSLNDKMHLSPDIDDEARVRAEKTIMIKLAGYIAQNRSSGRTIRSWRNYYASIDWLEALDAARWLIGSARAAMPYVGWLEYRTTDVIEHHWQDVKCVAGALLRQKTLSGAELQKTLMPV